MSERTTDRRKFLAASVTAVTAGLAGCGGILGDKEGVPGKGGSPEPLQSDVHPDTPFAGYAPPQTITVTLDNVGTDAWEVTNVENDDGVAPTGVENPTLTMPAGRTYRFENEGGEDHPLAFGNGNGKQLLSQSTDAQYNDSRVVRWADEGNAVEFRLFPKLASAIDNYRCTNHPSMTGKILPVEGDAIVRMSDQTTDGESVTVDLARLNEGGFIVVHDTSLSQEGAVASTVGVSEYLEPGRHDNIEVDLDEPLTSDQTLIPMAHEDTNDNETYDLEESGGEEDGPYTEGGEPVIDTASVTVDSS